MPRVQRFPLWRDLLRSGRLERTKKRWNIMSVARASKYLSSLASLQHYYKKGVLPRMKIPQVSIRQTASSDVAAAHSKQCLLSAFHMSVNMSKTAHSYSCEEEIKCRVEFRPFAAIHFLCFLDWYYRATCVFIYLLVLPLYTLSVSQ